MTSNDWLNSLDERLAAQVRFLMAADALKSVMRGTRVANGSRRENTAEHSWHLTLFALVLEEWATEPVEIGRVVQMLIVHDLIEFECGDTLLYEGDEAQRERERTAAQAVFSRLPDGQGRSLLALWEEFEACATPSAKFAKALDRLQPILLNHAAGGGTWTDADMDEVRERQFTGRIADGSAALWDLAQAVFADAVANGWLRSK